MTVTIEDYGDPRIRRVKINRPTLIRRLYNPPTEGRWLLSINPYTLLARIVHQQADGFVPDVEGHEDLFPLLMTLERADGFLDRGDWVQAKTPQLRHHDGIYRYYQIVWTDPNAGILSEADNRIVNPSSLQIFICHASDDKKEVLELYERLEKQAYNPWLDVQRLIAGQDWHIVIKEAIFSTDVVIVCLTEKLIGKSSFVLSEISYAVLASERDLEPNNFIIPVRFEPCEIPQNLLQWHCINYYEDSGWDALIESLRARNAILESKGRFVQTP